MAEQEYNLALEYGNSAFELLKRGQIPPYPHFYELLYTYASGINNALNERINRIFREGEAPGTDVAGQLYDEFLRSNEINERIDNVSKRMSARIEAVHSAIDTAMETAVAYSGSLRAATSDLDGEMSVDDLRLMAKRLLSETKRMHDTNSKLEQKLEVSRDDIAALQHDLDEVRKESMLDPLTKIFNRKYFDEGLQTSIAEARSFGDPLSLLMIDIDYFKRFNDSHGHQTGDQVLRLVAMTLKSNIKGRDIAARYGGEEFVAILPQTDYKSALSAAENIRRAIQAKELLKRSTNEKLGRVTASIGVATLRPQDTGTTIVERADRCLYAAKHAGRNCVIGEARIGDTQAA